MTRPSSKEKITPPATPKVPEVLKTIGEESRRNGTDKLTSRQIDATITAYRRAKKNAQK